MFYRLVTSIVAAVLSGMLTAAHAEESVTLRLKWFHQAQFAGFYVAKEKDFYKSAGLNVDIQPGGPDFPAIQMVTGGNEQFGVTGADQILIARSKGVPVVALAVIFRRNPFVLFSLAKSGIKTPADYVGKNIGVKIGGNEELIYRAVLAKAGVDKTKLNEIPVKFDITPLLAGAVDVWPGYLINEVLAAREKGFDVNVVSPPDYGIDLYADTLFTTEKMLKEKPDVVRKFVTATLKGWTTAIAAPEEAAQITVRYGSKLTYDHELAMMKASLSLLQPDAQPVGWMEAANWSATQKLLVDAGFQKMRVPVLANPAADGALADERVRAADMLYALGERNVVLYFVADLAEQSTDVAVLVALAELTGRHSDARAMLQIGKPALARGLAFDNYAFPTIGIPQHSPIGPEIERSIIYSVARTESAFDQRDKSPANAVGLMQVTPEAGRDTARRFGVTYDWDRMVSDPVYNTQMGAAELSALLKEYAGSHIMTFAGYNAGRGRVRDWVKLYGDPRAPNVDAIDWVERIPLSETRNYVQRVIENLLVYRVRFESGVSPMSKSDQRLGSPHEANSVPVLSAPTSAAP